MQQQPVYKALRLTLWIGTLVLLLWAPGMYAQNVSATLTGTAADSTGAVVPGAAVTVTNQGSGDIRRTMTNSDGYFTIAALPPATYTVSVQAKGFSRWEQKDIVLNSGDKRNVSNIVLAVAGANESVTVEASADELMTSVDSGEKAEVIGEKEMQNVAIVGRNAAEFIKILPGMALTGNLVNRPGYTGQDQGTNSGPIGSFSANGQRTGALDITADGAHVIDPGCNCGQAVNTNADMMQEMKVLTSNFSAENQKGPVVISAVGKSGGKDFHGEAYLYARHFGMNANDWLNNAAGLDASGKPNAPIPQTQYYYPGFQIGGPVLIPGTNFNKNRDKLFFFAAFEYYKQNVDNGQYRSFVPTAEMRAGNFSPGYLSNYLGPNSPAGYAVTAAPNDSMFPGGIIPASQMDPNGKIMTGLFPMPNVDPKLNQGYNYIQTGTKQQDSYQFRPRVDYSINDNTKLYISYNRQRDNAHYTDTLWWRPDPTVPFPSALNALNESDSISANLTRVFSPTLTNEVVFTYTYLNLPNSFADPKKVDRTALGMNYKTVFSNGVNLIPEITGWSDGVANMINPGGFELTGALYAKKTLPTLADNLAKVWGTHTLKFGFYWEATSNNQPASNNTNGTMAFSNWGGNTTGNAYADMLTGRISQYGEQNSDPLFIMTYHSVDFYAQDSWKVTRRLTLDGGLRFSHLGPWNDSSGYGMAIFDKSKYSDNPADVNKLTGIEWHKIDPSIPNSGQPGRFLFYEPRVGFAWDIFGSGRTVLRGGFGMFRFHDEQNVQAGAAGISRGSFGYTIPQSVTFNQIANYTTGFVAPGSVQVLDRLDTEQPRTMSYSFTIDERMPGHSVAEFSYVGNKSDYLSNWNNNFGNINDLPVGALFQHGIYDANANADPYRPMHNYQSIKVINHQMYSNYNSFQASWNKQSGHMTYMLNYTFSKALGIRGENGAPAGDPTNLANNYGVLPNDRTHIFNAAYVFDIPNMARSNRLMKGLINNWQISGITQWQSGINLQAAGSSNFNFSGTLPAGTVLPNGSVLSSDTGMNNTLMIGTPDVTLMPILTCDPRKNLQKNQFINGSCFAPPTVGRNGDFIFPYLRGPAFFNSDLSLFKNFPLSESKKLQFRFSAYNFLNHPITSFIPNDPGVFGLSFNAAGKLTNPQFGYAENKVGNRIIQLAVKFYF